MVSLGIDDKDIYRDQPKKSSSWITSSGVTFAMAQGPLPQLGLSQAGQEIGPVVAHEQQPWCNKDMTMASPGMMQKNPCRSGKKKKRPSGSNFSGVFRWQVVTSSPVFSSWKSCLYTQEITYGLIQSSPEMPLLDSNPKGHKPPMSSFAVSQGISKQIACGLTSLVAEANVPFRSPLTKKRDSVTHFRNQRVQFET